MTDNGNMAEYLGILIPHGDDSIFSMLHHFLINRIISSIPTVAKNILNKESGDELRRDHWNYRSVIEMRIYLVNCTHPEIYFAIHQCARFCNGPKQNY